MVLDLSLDCACIRVCLGTLELFFTWGVTGKTPSSHPDTFFLLWDVCLYYEPHQSPVVWLREEAHGGTTLGIVSNLCVLTWRREKGERHKCKNPCEFSLQSFMNPEALSELRRLSPRCSCVDGLFSAGLAEIPQSPTPPPEASNRNRRCRVPILPFALLSTRSPTSLL